MPHTTKRMIRLSIATLALLMILIVTAIGARAKASALRAEDMPTQIETDVIDLSKYVLLHRTRDAGSILIVMPESTPCETARQQGTSI